jgi:predicted permease
MTGQEGRLRRLLRSRVLGPSIARQVEEELDLHLELLVRELIAGGLDERAARREATARLGDRQALAAACGRQARGTERRLRWSVLIDELRQDVTYALRQLARARSFTAMALVTLAAGLGATTALWSVVEGVVLRRFPFAHPERTVLVAETWKDSDSNFSAGNFVDLAASTASTRSFSSLAALQFSALNLAWGPEPTRVLAGRVTGGFFEVFGVRPILGRGLGAPETEAAEESVAVLSHALWAERMGADRAIVGKTIRLSNHAYRVLGVMPETFDPTASHEELWLPLVFTPAQRAQHDEHYLNVVGLLRPGTSARAAQAELSAEMRRLAARFPRDNAGRQSVRVASLSTFILGDVPRRLYILLGAVGLVVLIACANVASLLLARGAQRRNELALRAAIGAGGRRLVRQLLTESAVLGLAAGTLGTGLAFALVKLFVRLAPPGIPRLGETRIDGGVLLFAVLLSLAASLLCGLVPALRSARQSPQALLRGGMSSEGPSRDRLRHLLVAGEIALALTLLIGAGLLIRSALHLERLPLGFDPAGVLTARVGLSESAYPRPRAVEQAFEEIVEGLARRPGVRAAAAGSGVPLEGYGGSNGLLPEGQAFSPENLIDATFHLVTPGYLETLRIPLLAGRTFNAADRAGGDRVMVVSRALARRAWGDADPIGKRMACCEDAAASRLKTVIGVVGDVRTRGPASAVRPEFYLPMAQAPQEGWKWLQRTVNLVVRGDSPAALAAALRGAVHEVDPTLPVPVAALEDALRRSLAEQRFHTALLLGLGLLGLLLATVGIYGVIAYFASQRTREIGIRMALGAGRARIVRHLAIEGALPLAGGLLLGAAGALAATRWLEGSLYGVSATDPATFAAVVAILGATGWIAILLPALRATRIDPTRAIQAG